MAQIITYDLDLFCPARSVQNNAKVSISIDANAVLESMLAKTNDGFKEGRVSKQALLSWLVLAHEKIGFEKSIAKIRAANLDPILVLKAKIEEIRASRKAPYQK